MTPEEAVPSLIEKPEGCILTVWVIYDHPGDFPDAWVLRPQFVMPGQIDPIISRIAWFAQSIDELRSIIPPGCFCLSPMPGDSPAIAETWV